MNSEVENVKSYTESEEDDFGCYFLQPTSTPYNITEKVQQANVDLFTSSPCLSVKEKNGKVKFRDELVSFEPDLTDDDVNSIESDNIDSESHLLAYKTTIVDCNNMYDIEEVEEKLICEEIIEEIQSEYDLGVQSIEHKSKPDQVETEEIIEEFASGLGKRSLHRRKCIKNNLFVNANVVHCREHCIDKLDFDLSMSIKKLEIHDKVSLPPLQLIQRKCCDEIKQKIPKNLPNYNGMRSEYGLTSRQLEKRQKQQEKLKQRELTRQKLMEDYRKRKIQQNEEVFCQWLKEVAHRKSENRETTKKHKSKQNMNQVLNLPGKSKDRPKTANQFFPKTNIKKKRRPHSTHSSIYIEVPRVLLEKGVNIGDIIISNAKLFSRNLHILAKP